MVIHKILNNNLILSRDGQGHEVIVKGCGIAFQKKKGQQVEESRIEKIFTAENAQISKEIQGYLTAIPEKYLDFVEAFVNEVKEKEGMKLNDSIYFSLSDHIMGAISRLENGIRLQNMLLLDIKQINEQEHIKLELVDSKSSNIVNGIAFGQSASARYIKSKRSFDIAYTIEDNVFKRNMVQLQIEDIRVAEED